MLMLRSDSHDPGRSRAFKVMQTDVRCSLIGYGKVMADLA